jgi:hypothetical protein
MARVVDFLLNGIRNKQRGSDVSADEVVVSKWRDQRAIGELGKARIRRLTCCVYGRIRAEV